MLGAILGATLLPRPIGDLGELVFRVNRDLDAKRKTTTLGDESPISSAKKGVADGEPDNGTETNSSSVEGSDGKTELNPPVKRGLDSPIPATAVDDPLTPPRIVPPVGPLALLGLILGGAIGSILWRVGERLDVRWKKMSPGDRFVLVGGIFAGIITGGIVSVPFQPLFQHNSFGPWATVLMMLGCSLLIVLLLRDVAPSLNLGLVTGRVRRTGLKILDTNVLIDGRVYDLMKTGFIDGEVYIPQFVLHELQHIADSADALRRQRGRRGLDVVKRIQSEFDVEVGTRDRPVANLKEEVDSKLVKLSKALGADLVSNDFNLNQVASVQEVKVLNINDLALALRPNVLPGEPLDVLIVKEGSQAGQGVGYLDDGTMVVVEHGSELIGQQAETLVTQVIQTERGKMIFADAEADPSTFQITPMKRGVGRPD